MRRLLEDATVRLMGVKVNIHDYRHLAIAIGRRYLHGILKDPTQSGEDHGFAGEDSDEDGFATVLAHQAAHTVLTDGITYGRTRQQFGSGTALQQEQFLQASLIWHQFLAFQSAKGKTKMEKTGLAPYEVERQSIRALRLQHLQQVDLAGMLRQMLQNPLATFRGSQEAVLQAIVQGRSPIVQIAGTGEGKSLSFLLPAYCAYDGVTVVIVPLLALQTDFERRCQELKISSHTWSYGRVKTARIVFITPESAVSKGFQDFISGLVVRQQLDRVIIDECHMVLDASHTFRPQFLALGRTIVNFGVQLVLLTATLAVRDQAHFFQAIGIDALHTQVFRGITTRRNIGYEVTQVASAAEEAETIVRYISSLQQEQPSIRIIVYCMRTIQATILADKLDCILFHSKVDRAEGKAQRLQQWIQKGGPIVSTNALGVGLDIPDVRYIFHLGLPFQLRDYIQESGRGGRDGLKSHSIIVTSKDISAAPSDASTQRLLKTADIAEYVRGLIGCRRVYIDQIMDGRTDRLGCEAGEIPCDLCTKEKSKSACPTSSHQDMETEQSYNKARESLRALDQATQWQQEYVRQQLEAEQGQLERFREFLQEFSGYCTICYGYGAMQRHNHQDCPQAQGKFARQLYETSTQIEAILQRMKVEAYAGCYYCYLPTMWCDRWVKDKGDLG
ncbi:Fc.00g010580.m01.CDS01, partial [Cosmosporella sp. VM-42]